LCKAVLIQAITNEIPARSEKAQLEVIEQDWKNNGDRFILLTRKAGSLIKGKLDSLEKDPLSRHTTKSRGVARAVL
jgi:hypothetical protein